LIGSLNLYLKNSPDRSRAKKRRAGPTELFTQLPTHIPKGLKNRYPQPILNVYCNYTVCFQVYYSSNLWFADLIDGRDPDVFNGAAFGIFANQYGHIWDAESLPAPEATESPQAGLTSAPLVDGL
jgi:3-mercaptopyruvate sulfurtransferase SseA